MTNFDKAFELLILIEGDYSNHPYDPGKATKYGITESVARSHGYKGDMRDLTLDIAKNIYKKSYWDINRLDEIKHYSIQEEIFECGVNCGPSTALKFMQRAYNTLVTSNYLTIDGKIGPKTISSINNCKFLDDLYDTANILQGFRYIKLAEKDDKYKAFYKGWIRKRVKIKYN